MPLFAPPLTRALSRLVPLLALSHCGPSSGPSPYSELPATASSGADSAASAAPRETWLPLSHCAGIDAAAGVNAPPGGAHATHVVNALLESASCWLTDAEFNVLNTHRLTLPTSAPLVAAAYATVDRAARMFAPLALDATGRRDDAARLRALAPIVDEETRAAAETVLRGMLPEDLRRGALPPPGEIMFVPAISLDDGHGCTTAHFPTGSHLTAADAAVATAAMASVNLAARAPITAEVRVQGDDAPVRATTPMGPATMFIGGSQGASVTACFAIQARADRARVISALQDALDAITSAR